MYGHYKHKSRPNAFLFHKEGTPRRDALEEFASIYNWDYLGDVVIEANPEQYRKVVLAKGS